MQSRRGASRSFSKTFADVGALEITRHLKRSKALDGHAPRSDLGKGRAQGAVSSADGPAPACAARLVALPALPPREPRDGVDRRFVAFRSVDTGGLRRPHARAGNRAAVRH